MPNSSTEQVQISNAETEILPVDIDKETKVVPENDSEHKNGANTINNGSTNVAKSFVSATKTLDISLKNHDESSSSPSKISFLVKTKESSNNPVQKLTSSNGSRESKPPSETLKEEPKSKHHKHKKSKHETSSKNTKETLDKSHQSRKQEPPRSKSKKSTDAKRSVSENIKLLKSGSLTPLSGLTDTDSSISSSLLSKSSISLSPPHRRHRSRSKSIDQKKKNHKSSHHRTEDDKKLSE